MSDFPRSPRTILPRAHPEGTSISESTVDSQQAVHEARPSNRGRSAQLSRSNIRSACLSCRQRRSKCTGSTPCSRCSSLGTECVYDEAQDRRTRAVRDKGKVELDLYRKVLDGVCTAIRSGENQPVLELIRKNAPLRVIAEALPVQEDLDESEDSSSAMPDSPRLHSTPLGMSTPGSFLDKLPENAPAPNTLGSYQNSLVRTQATNYPARKPHPSLPLPMLGEATFNYMITPLHAERPELLDQVSHYYTAFRDLTRQMLAQGFPSVNVLGPGHIVCNSLVDSAHPTNSFNAAFWASSLLRNLPQLDVYFRLAWFVMLVRFIQWAIDPSEARFDCLPGLIKPTPLQLSYTHTPQIDLAPFPDLRDVLIHNFRDYASALALSGVDVGWDAPWYEAVHSDPVTGDMIITNAFEQHVARLSSLAIGKNILQTFPEFENGVRIIVSEQPFIPPKFHEGYA